VDPFVGIGTDARISSTGPLRSEDQGFVREIYVPADRSTPPRLKILYFPRLRASGVLTRPSLRDRPRVTITLRLQEAPYGVTPYYYDFVSEAVDYSDEPSETLRLYVDRSIQIDFPSDVRRVPSTREQIFLIDLPDTPMGISRLPLQVAVYRAQLEAQIPQSAEDSFVLDAVPQTWVEEIAPDPASAPRWRPIVHKTARPDGGCSLMLSRQVVIIAGSYVGAGTSYGNVEQLAELSIGYWHMDVVGAYHVQVDTSRDERWRLMVTVSNNCWITMQVNGALIDLSRALGDEVLRARLASLQDEWGIDLQLRSVSLRDVMRPGQTDNTEGVAWHSPDGMRLIHRLDAMSDPGRETAYLLLTTGVGFIPVVGDLFDLGQLVFALITGEDFSGEPMEADDLILLAIALLPGVPSAISSLESRLARVRSRLDAAAVGFEQYYDAVATSRPALARLLGTRSSPRSAERFLALLSAHVVESRAAQLGQLRNAEVIQALQRAGRRRRRS
jgi:hypothetical protein